MGDSAQIEKRKKKSIIVSKKGSLLVLSVHRSEYDQSTYIRLLLLLVCLLLKFVLYKDGDLLYKDYGDKQPANHFRYDCVDSNFDVSCQCDAIVPGLSTAFRSIIPDSGGVELRYLHDYAGFTAGIGLKAGRHNHLQSVGLDRIVKFSVVAGNTVLSLGTDAAFDISTRTFSNYNAGLSFNTALFTASVNLNDKLENLRASYYQELVPLTRTAVAAEFKHSFSNHRSISDNIPIPTNLTVGFQHGLFPSTLVKVRVNTNGKVGAHVQQSFWQKFSIAVSGETDIRASSWTPNVRFGMAFSS